MSSNLTLSSIYFIEVNYEKSNLILSYVYK